MEIDDLLPKVHTPKKLNNLYQQIYTDANIDLAVAHAAKGRSKNYGVRKFRKDETLNKFELYLDLRNCEYKTSPYSTFTVYEPKERLIYRLPFYPDRIAHHAIMNILQPIWEKVFIRNTYSCIPNRGIHLALSDIKRDLQKDLEGTWYCLKMDIKKFYPSIDHDILKKIIRRKIKDKSLLIILDEIIDSAPGVPIGNYLSQYFANLYLTYFDHWVKEILKVKYYYRYADDIVILKESKEILFEWQKEIENYLNNKLKLVLKPNWQVFPVYSRGIDFLGYVIRHEGIRVRKSTKKRMFRAFKRFPVRQDKLISEIYELYNELERDRQYKLFMQNGLDIPELSGMHIEIQKPLTESQIKNRKRRLAKLHKLFDKQEAIINSYGGWLRHCDSTNLCKKLNRQFGLNLDNWDGEKVNITSIYGKFIIIKGLRLHSHYFEIKFLRNNKRYTAKSRSIRLYNFLCNKEVPLKIKLYDGKTETTEKETEEISTAQ